MNRDTLRQWVNVLAVVATIVINALANAIPFNGLNTGEISDRFQVFFVPAGYVFSIWGLIYLALIAFAIYQVLPSQRENPALRRVGYWFAFSCAANIVWLFLWHYELFPLTLVFMIALLLSLIVIYQRLEIGRERVSPAQKWLVHVPFSIYLGWITVATIANVTDVLDYVNWNGWGIAPQTWAVIMLVAGLGITAAMITRRGDSAYALVIAWAFAGIGVKQAGAPLVSGAAWLMTALVVAGLFLPLISARLRTNP